MQSHCVTLCMIYQGFCEMGIERRNENKIFKIYLPLLPAPLPECSMVPTSKNGIITVNWDYVYTGGLSFTSIQILYRESSKSVYKGSMTGDKNCTSKCSLDFATLAAMPRMMQALQLWSVLKCCMKLVSCVTDILCTTCLSRLSVQWI